MTDEQINEKVAFELGWRQLREGRWKLNGRVERSAPDYCNDLNAMHEAEQQLRDFDEWMIYDKALAETAEGFTWHATARQRAESFLRTLNLWEE